MATDSSGQPAVDFVWGAFPVQPNDDRAATISNTGGTTGSTLTSNKTFVVTAASASGGVVTYTAANTLQVGEIVTITGLSTSAFNLTGVTVATANATSFTVTNSANAGVITAQTGKVETTTAGSAADGVGLGNIIVPNVLGATTAVALDALKDAGYEAGNITTASAATNAAKTVTAASRTEGNALVTITATGATAAYPVGTKITVANTGDATINGTWTVTANASTNQVKFVSESTAAAALTGLSGTVVGVEGTIKVQSTAANAAGVATGDSITITPWAAAS